MQTTASLLRGRARAAEGAQTNVSFSDAGTEPPERLRGNDAGTGTEVCFGNLYPFSSMLFTLINI